MVGAVGFLWLHSQKYLRWTLPGLCVAPVCYQLLWLFSQRCVESIKNEELVELFVGQVGNGNRFMSWVLETQVGWGWSQAGIPACRVVVKLPDGSQVLWHSPHVNHIFCSPALGRGSLTWWTHTVPHCSHQELSFCRFASQMVCCSQPPSQNTFGKLRSGPISAAHLKVTGWLVYISTRGNHP